MSVALPEFFAQMHPYLLGRRELATVEDALGRSPSGGESFAFYRVLAERNLFKIMRELFGPLHTLVRREDPERWRSLVASYIEAHPPVARHPNGFGEAFPVFLAQRREQDDPEQPALWEEIADFCWIRTAVAGAPDGEDDGFERRLFVRQYSHPVPEIVGTLERDAEAELPPPRPILVLVYRHWQTLQTRLFQPSAAGLVALARRQGLPVPGPLQAIPREHVDIADEQLVSHGVLGPRGE
ncbi:MAG: putative DNA-binding domain-containing protein [Myxococcales bacterium]|nr:putative DNA-binding domain-containing protein [Myxococcales bacterium]MCB9714213.1 putative DNA-binding domain-containing protein [Myxococcales bacterium]